MKKFRLLRDLVRAHRFVVVAPAWYVRQVAPVTFEDLPIGLKRYRTIVIDPPWRYDRATAPQVGAEQQYDGTITYADLANLPIPQLADGDAHLWLWYTNAFLEEAANLLHVWGFRVMTQLTWIKSGMGMGYYLRNTTEHCILAKRGHIAIPEERQRNLQSYLHAKRAKHSRKPDEAYDIIRAISPGPRLDMFARAPRQGFDRWGNQLLVWSGFGYVESEHHFLEDKV